MTYMHDVKRKAARVFASLVEVVEKVAEQITEKKDPQYFQEAKAQITQFEHAAEMICQQIEAVEVPASID